MLWLKAFHIIFVVTWFAGLFYLPRLFVYHVEATEAPVRTRLKVMERRLLGITHIGGGLTILFGLALTGWWSVHDPALLFARDWFYVKLALVALLIIYHVLLVRMTKLLASDRLGWTSRALRIFNEVPALLLIGIVVMVVVKPF